MFSQVQVETTSRCNSDCLFCPHNEMPSYGTMEDSLYRKIVDDAAQYPLTHFIPMLTGEPFSDPDIIERLRYAREKLQPETKIRLHTNGSLMTMAEIDAMAELPNIEIFVSINGATREMRHEMMGIDDFNAVVPKIDYLEKKGILHQTSMVWYPNIPLEHVNMMARFPRACIFTFHNSCGLSYRYRRIRPTNCSRIHDILSVKVNGDVCLCCFDVLSKVVFGNVREKSLKEIWESELRVRYEEMHSKFMGEKMPLCGECTQG